jgi:hypothetical protein
MYNAIAGLTVRCFTVLQVRAMRVKMSVEKTADGSQVQHDVDAETVRELKASNCCFVMSTVWLKHVI